MMSPALVIGASFAYLLLLFAVAYLGDWRAAQGRSIIVNPWTYALSLVVYCTAWTYFGSVGRAASGGVWFLPIYLGPTLTMPGQVPPLLADPDRLMQVILNLLSNAAKFVLVPGGRVGVRLDRDETGITVAVRDNGPGVASEQQGLIFDRFRQGGEATNRPQGTGLGLPISRQIVENFGGKLWLESSPGQGVSFKFHLPWHAAAMVPAPL